MRILFLHPYGWRGEYPMLLDAQWQKQQLIAMNDIYPNSVLLYKAGFASLTAPHKALEKAWS